MAEAAPLKICMVTTFYPPYHFGGDAIYVHRLVEALAARGHRVDVIHSVDAYRVLHPDEPELEFEHHPNVRLHTLWTDRPRLAALRSHQTGRPGAYERQLRSLLEGNDFDVIHYHNVSLMGAPEILRLGRAIKLYTAHEYWLICPTHILFRFDREACTKRTCLRCTLYARRPPQLWRRTGGLERALAQVDCLIMSSRFALEAHRAQGIARPMVVLPPPLPIPPEDALLCAPVSGRPSFLCVGRLEKAKGVHDVIEAARELGGAELVVVGEGPYGDRLRAQAQGLSHVRFTGNQSPAAVADLYREATALVAASLCYETFGLSVAEAMAHAKPAIVRRRSATSAPTGTTSAKRFTCSTPRAKSRVFSRNSGATASYVSVVVV